MDKTRLSPQNFFKTLSESGQEAVYVVDFTNEFKKNVKLSYKRNLDLNLLKDIVVSLSKGESLAPKHRAHTLSGYYKTKENETVMECHIQPDWLLVWIEKGSELTLILTDTGTHSDLFRN
jgi:mRNA interferase YafQ